MRGVFRTGKVNRGKNGSGINGNRAFNLIIGGTLVASVVFALLLIVSTARYIRWKHFFDVLLSREILFALKLSLFVSTVASLIAVSFALPISYALSRFRFPGRNIIDTIFDIPIVLSPIAIGAVLLIFFNNTIIGKFVEEHIVRFTFEIPGIILAQFVVVSALAVRLLKSTFDSIDLRYEGVIRTLGATRFQSLIHVTLPMAKHGIVGAFIVTWARAIGEFGATLTLAGATTMKTETLPIAIFLSFAKADVQQAIIVILILLSLAIAVLLLIRKLSGEVMTW